MGLAFSQKGKVGIATENPQATLDIVPATTLPTNKLLNILNSDGKTLMNGLDNGDIGFGIRENGSLPLGQITAFGENGKGMGSPASFLVNYTDVPGQKWGYYINPKQGDFNPALPGYFSFYMDRDGIMGAPYFNYDATTYINSAYGNYFGFHDNSRNLGGLFFTDHGNLILSSYRVDRQNLDEQNQGRYVTSLKIGLLSNVSLRVKDENKGYAVGQSCLNPGTIAMVGNDFLGCAEVYNDDVNTGEKIWKKLNN